MQFFSNPNIRVVFVGFFYEAKDENSDGKQFHKYQQNKKITSHLESFIKQKTPTCDVGNPGPGLRRTQKCDGVKPVNGIPDRPS